ncbi:TlpA family protein disulfide reductase, partial [candidate division WOR-3 bacterium]|nr:TlpA family protein disulfide reductase [candidate division WOR-3 bacterium]
DTTAQPVLTWEPETPAWGEKVTLIYHHDAPNALIKGQVPLYANIRGGEILEFKRSGNISTAQFEAPDSVSKVQIYFYSLEDWDKYASVQIPLKTPDDWSSIEEELEQIRRIFLAASANRVPRETAKAILDSLLSNPVENPYYYYVLTDAHMRLGEADSGWAALGYVRDNYSGTDEYAMALGAYDYSAYTNPDLTSPARMNTFNRWVDEEIGKSMSTYLLMDVVTRWMKDSTHLSLKKREKILARFVKQNPQNPLIRSFLAMHYAHAGDTAAAEEEYTKAISLIVEGTAAKEIGGLYVNSQNYYRWLEEWMLERGKLKASREKYDEALADFSFTILMKGDYEGEAWFERAKVWQRLERYRRTEGSLVKALKAGYTDAEPALKGIYLLLYGKEGYEEYLSERLKPSESDEFRSATDFGFTDLEGNPGRFLDYRGKIVVINYWGLGCGPCKKEIPWLNELAEEYDGKGVEFLAFSFDKAEAQKDYFKDHPFEYTNLIPEGAGLFRSIGLASCPYPWHAVVDPQGRVRFTRIGGREDNSDMKLVIDQLLREQELMLLLPIIAKDRR